MKFSSKAKNLIELKKLNLKKSDIPTFYKYKIEEIKRIKKNFKLPNKKSIKKNLYQIIIFS